MYVNEYVSGYVSGEVFDDVLAERTRELGELMEVISAEVARDGGTAELGRVDYRAGRVEVVLAGACGSCSLTGATLEDGIKRILTQRLDWVTEVEGTVREERGLVGRNGWRPLDPG
jgi:Fe-S cluster biogenesis protein NfuA